MIFSVFLSSGISEQLSDLCWPQGRFLCWAAGLRSVRTQTTCRRRPALLWRPSTPTTRDRRPSSCCQLAPPSLRLGSLSISSEEKMPPAGIPRNLKFLFCSHPGDQRDQLRAVCRPGKDQLPEDGDAGDEQLHPGAEGPSSSHCCCWFLLLVVIVAYCFLQLLAAVPRFSLQLLLLLLLLLLLTHTTELSFLVCTASQVSLCCGLWPPRRITPAATPEMHKTSQEEELSLGLFKYG